MESAGDRTSVSSVVDSIADSDVVIVAADVDDHPITPGSDGWVTKFSEHMQVRLQQLSGQSLKVKKLTRLPTEESDWKAMLPALEKLDAVVCVVSPAFLMNVAAASL